MIMPAVAYTECSLYVMNPFSNGDIKFLSAHWFSLIWEKCVLGNVPLLSDNTSSLGFFHFCSEWLSVHFCLMIFIHCLTLFCSVQSNSPFFSFTFCISFLSNCVAFFHAGWDGRTTSTSRRSSSSLWAGVSCQTQTARGHPAITVTCTSCVTAPMVDSPQFL